MSEVGTILQWNMGCSYAPGAADVDPALAERRCALVEALIEEHKPTFVALQEAPRTCASRLKGKLAQKYGVVPGKKGLITLHSIDWFTSEQQINNELRATMILLEHKNLGVRIRVWNIHLWSLLRLDRSQAHSKARMFVNDHIRKQRAASSVTATEIIVGDFNMCPYDQPALTKDCLWGNQSLHWTLARERSASRKPTKSVYVPLFNPSWELLGHHAPPFGTYYYGNGEDVDGPWYVFDQLLMSPNHGLTNQRHTMILEKANDTQLWSNDKIRQPDDQIGSDHYPVLVKFKLR
jgi:exonuclease III